MVGVNISFPEAFLIHSVFFISTVSYIKLVLIRQNNNILAVIEAF